MRSNTLTRVSNNPGAVQGQKLKADFVLIVSGRNALRFTLVDVKGEAPNYFIHASSQNLRAPLLTQRLKHLVSIADIHIVTALLKKVVASHKTGKKAAAPAKFKRLQALAEEVRVEAKTRAEIVRQKIKRRKGISELSVEEVRKNSY